YSGQTRDQILNQIQNQDPRPPRAIDKTIPPELETIITTAIAKEAAERYSSARAFADDLLRYLRDEPILARKPSLRSRALKWGRRPRDARDGSGLSPGISGRPQRRPGRQRATRRRRGDSGCDSRRAFCLRRPRSRAVEAAAPFRSGHAHGTLSDRCAGRQGKTV